MNAMLYTSLWGGIHVSPIHVLFSPTASGSPTSLDATQVNLTSLSVSWTPAATVAGYQVYWSGDRGYDSGNMSVGAEDRSVTITGRTTGLTYNITLVPQVENFNRLLSLYVIDI